VNDELMAQFAQLQRYTAALHQLITTAQEQSPRRSEGADATGAVRVELGPDGLPTIFRVDGRWDRMLAPEEFGAAVVQACQAAIGERMAEWTESLQSSGWQHEAARLRGGPDAQPTAPMVRVPPAFRRPLPDVTPRSLDQITEDMLAAFDDTARFSPPPTHLSSAGTGAAAGGKLVITLSPAGLTSCTADGRWVIEQTAARLMNALSEALAAAKADLDRPTPQALGRPGNGMDRLLAEAMTLLTDPRRLA
jgi:hypothetical protein